MKILHETCLEYFRRRLSEGWRCVSLEGHNAVLLSPEGIRRELDLRNDIVTLRPNADTAIQEWTPKGGGDHYVEVDEESHDDDATYVYTISPNATELFDIANSELDAGTTINKITLYMWASYYPPTLKYHATYGIKSGGTEYWEDFWNWPASYTEYSKEYTTDPNTDSPWTVAAINALQIGVKSSGEAAAGGLCTQMYVEVDFTFVPPTPPVTTEYQKRETARIGTEAEATLRAIISRVTEFAADSGTATSGSQTTCVDTAKNWETDMWKGAVIEIYSVADDIYYLRTISGNAATTITFAALPGGKAVASGDSYAIRLTIGLVDLDKWGGTALTGRDVSLDLKALTDISITGVLKSIGDIAAAESLIARIGAIADAVVDAGATGSVSAKLRRLTTDINALITQLTEDIGDKTTPDAGSLNARVGEVQPSPTANTLLDRLKTIATDIGTLTTQLNEDIGDKTTPDTGSINARLGEVQASPTVNTLLARLKDLATLIGEVQASPTANTLLARLKDIETAIGALTPAAGTPVIYNVTMTLADTEYDQALPANTKKYTIQTRDGTAFRMAFVTGKVAGPTEPYLSIGTDGFHHEDSINPASLTLYFACGDAGKVAEILAWS